MSTNLDLITASLRLCKVLAETETASAEQGESALGFLNRMLESWAENRIDLGWYEQADTTAETPLAKWAEQGVISKLAQLLSGLYDETALARWVWDDRLNGYGMIARRMMVEQLQPANMDHMPMGSTLRPSNIETDEA